MAKIDEVFAVLADANNVCFQCLQQFRSEGDDDNKSENWWLCGEDYCLQEYQGYRHSAHHESQYWLWQVEMLKLGDRCAYRRWVQMYRKVSKP